MLRGYDISAYQSAIPGDGDFEILKATEGLSYDDGPFQARWLTLEHRGTLRGAYHFAHPSNDPIAEADHFVSVVRKGGLRPGDVLVLDHETPTSSPSHDAAWARAWCAHVEQQTGIRPAVYIMLSMAWEGRCAGLERYPLWIADPSSSIGHPRVPAPWTSWALHQYSEAGGLDHDVFNGDRTAWLALGGHTPTPQPQQEDDMPQGQLNQVPAGPKGIANTPISFPGGKYKNIGFIVDNGYLGVTEDIELRIAEFLDAGNWELHDLKLNSHGKKGTLAISPNATGLSVSFVGKVVPVGWDMS